MGLGAASSRVEIAAHTVELLVAICHTFFDMYWSQSNVAWCLNVTHFDY